MIIDHVRDSTIILKVVVEVKTTRRLESTKIQ